ncbi:hypothetical protein [Pantoea sp. BAV 3049]|uniref:hypothetical protein n=1 Tax=Pantoea sp. BAV 3049 TaxID=2654188 RepID=UPI00131BBB98|nr:hypothetical protein [Pantoea sp. BAV 3049]
MDYKDSIEWHDAMEWLQENYAEFPDRVLTGPCKTISNLMFKNWRWVLTLENEIVFGNCYQPGITKLDFEEYKSAMVKS